MKHLFLISVMFALCITPAFSEEDIEIENTHDEAQNGPGGGARSLQTLLTASHDDSYLRVNIYYYVGNATIYLYNNVGTLVGMNSDYINGQSSIETSLQGLPQGSYSLQIVLDSGSYSGRFTL